MSIEYMPFEADMTFLLLKFSPLKSYLHCSDLYFQWSCRDVRVSASLLLSSLAFLKGKYSGGMTPPPGGGDK